MVGKSHFNVNEKERGRKKLYATKCEHAKAVAATLN